jgi:hypothetical protein
MARPAQDQTPDDYWMNSGRGYNPQDGGTGPPTDTLPTDITQGPPAQSNASDRSPAKAYLDSITGNDTGNFGQNVSAVAKAMAQARARARGGTGNRKAQPG